MRVSRIFSLVSACLGLAAGLAAFPFWLEAPSRANPKDPKSPAYRLLVTSTPLPTTVIFTPTSTPTPSSEASPSPTPTPSPTPPLWYDGDRSGYQLADGTATIDTDTAPGKGSMGISESSLGGGALGSPSYMVITASAGTGTWYARASYAAAGAPFDMSAQDALSLWIRIPSNACANHVRPSIQLRTTGAWPNDRSALLTATAYLDGTTVLGYDEWTRLLIPLSAFVGPNTDGGSFSAAGLSAVTAVVVGAWNYSFDSTGGLALSEIHVDQVEFVNAAAGSARDRGVMFDDFETDRKTLWFDRDWQFSSDLLACTPTTSITFPSGGNPPVDAGGNSLSACRAGHMAGFQNTNAPCTWSPPYLDPWPLVRMMVDFWQGPLDLSNNSVVHALPASGARGLALRMKRGNPSLGQIYTVSILRSATNADWNNYHFRVDDADLSTSWQEFRVDFPPDGQAAGSQDHSGNVTELWWGQEAGWGAPAAWGRTDFLKLIIRVKNGGDFDLWVDDIEFY